MICCCFFHQDYDFCTVCLLIDLFYILCFICDILFYYIYGFIQYYKTIQFILSSSKELTSWVKLQLEIFCKASRRRALQKICICSLTHDVSSLEDDNVFVFCVAFF